MAGRRLDAIQEHAITVYAPIVPDTAASSKEKHRRVVRRRETIELRDGFKHYGIFNHWKQILRNFCMEARAGEIYAILGPHACGKTTVLRILLGTCSLIDGEVRIFGRKKCHIGQVGYMPQTRGLFVDFTIKETLHYYSRLMRLPNAYAKQRINFLQELLYLPLSNKRLNWYGEHIQRRVSFAIAILNEPSVLLLDEPTQGINPILKKSMWKHMKHMAHNDDVTIILSTQSSIEAEWAHRVGIMRYGRILLEEDLQPLLTRNQESHLEAIYDKIYADEPLKRQVVDTVFPMEMQAVSSEGFDITGQSLREAPYRNSSQSTISPTMRCCHATTGTFKCILTPMIPNFWTIFLLCWKDFTHITRNSVWLLAVLIVPTGLIMLTYTSIGTQPKNLNIGIMNEEKTGENCPYYAFSCQLLMRLNSDIIHLREFRNESALRKSALRGELVGFVVIRKTFTEHMIAMLTDFLFGTSKAFLAENSYIRITMDVTDPKLAEVVEMQFKRTFWTMISPIDIDMGPILDEYPLEILKPFYGSEDATEAQFVGPGLVVSWFCLLTAFASVKQLIHTRDNNLRDMHYVAGVKLLDRLIAFVLTYGVVIVSHTLLTVALLVRFCGMPFRGKIRDLILVLCPQLLFVVSVGILIGVFCKTLIVAATFVLYAIIVSNTITGVQWSTAILPTALSRIASYLPQTVGIKAVRAIILKGYTFHNEIVLHAIYMPTLYAIVMLLFSSVLNKLRLTV